MKILSFGIALLIATCLLHSDSKAAIVFFNLAGQSGTGLLAGNEVGVSTGTGTGGVTGGGIFFDDVSKVLTINVGWGSASGFTNSLTGVATAMHIHGPASFTQNASVVLGLKGLPGFSSSANGGGFTGSVNLNATNEASLLANLLYINVHTTANAGGEIRGNITAVPEPTSLCLLGLTAAGFSYRRIFRRNRNS